MNKLLRVNVQQPALPHYRVPLFRLLAQHKGWNFIVFHGSEEPALPNSAAESFQAELHLAQSFKLPVLGTLFWQRVQWTLANPRCSDVLVLCWQTRFLSLIPALLRARFHGIPVVLWGHGYSKSPAAWRNRLRNLPVLLASKVLLYDSQTKVQLIQAGLPANKLHVADNGLDSDAIKAAIDYWQQRPVELQAFRKTHGLDSGPVLIHVARLMADNRLDCIIHAMSQMLENFPTLKLVVIGKGQSEKDRLQELSNALQIDSHLVWGGEVYDERALCPWMLSADIFVYPANTGLALIHAFNYGLPALLCAPRSAHNPEAQALVHAHNGWLAKSLQSDDVVEALTQLLNSPELLQQLSQAAVASVQQHFNIRAMAESISNLIESLADTTATRH